MPAPDSFISTPMTVWLEHHFGSPPLCFHFPPVSCSSSFVVPGQKPPAQTWGDSCSLLVLSLSSHAEAAFMSLVATHHTTSALPREASARNFTRSSQWFLLISLLDLTAGINTEVIWNSFHWNISAVKKKKKTKTTWNLLSLFTIFAFIGQKNAQSFAEGFTVGAQLGGRFELIFLVPKKSCLCNHN